MNEKDENNPDLNKDDQPNRKIESSNLKLKFSKKILLIMFLVATSLILILLNLGLIKNYNKYAEKSIDTKPIIIEEKKVEAESKIEDQKEMTQELMGEPKDSVSEKMTETEFRSSANEDIAESYNESCYNQYNLLLATVNFRDSLKEGKKFTKELAILESASRADMYVTEILKTNKVLLNKYSNLGIKNINNMTQEFDELVQLSKTPDNLLNNKSENSIVSLIKAGLNKIIKIEKYNQKEENKNLDIAIKYMEEDVYKAYGFLRDNVCKENQMFSRWCEEMADILELHLITDKIFYHLSTPPIK